MAQYFHRLASYAAKDKLAVVDSVSSPASEPRQHTYAQLLSRINVYNEVLTATAYDAQQRLEGARVGLMVPPGLDFVAALLAIWSVSAIAVPICLTHPLQEITHTVTDSGQDFIIYHAAFKQSLQPLIGNRTCIDTTTVPQGARPKERLDFSAINWATDTACLIIYTSGTTGLPKGVVQTAKSLESSFGALSEAWQMTPQDHVLHVLPLHHGHGLMLSLLLPLWNGATVEFMPKFDERLVWQRILDTKLPVTVFMAVPTIWVKLIDHFDQHYKSNTEESRARNAAGSLRLAISGSAALPASTRDAWANIANGYLLLERYGTTETGITYSGRLTPNGRVQGSVGWPLPAVESRLVAADGRDVTNVPGVMGEIQIKSNGLLKEYWGKPSAKAKELTPDGWWRTGDLAMIKSVSGPTYIQGRASVDIIKSGGYKISGLDVEAELLKLPYVKEVAVVGVTDKVWGEVVAAICVPKGNQHLTIATIRQDLRSQLAAYKLPQKLHVLKEMPRNAMGKIQKKALKEQCFPQQTRAKL